jgi:glycosyltransferase involved in cell wall biosynthesis
MGKKKELNSTGIETLYIRQFPPISRCSLMIDERRILSPFYHWWGNKEKVMIHCRGHLNSFRGLLLKRRNPELIHVIADLRGAVADEVLHGRGGMVGNLFTHYLRDFYQRVEDQVVRKADRILCVSNAFKEFLQAKYGIDHISVIPTFVDTSQFNFSKSVRELHRKKLGISNRIVLVYSGGVAPWQRVGDVIKFFVGMRQRIENLFMLFLSHEPSVIHQMLNGKIEPRDVKVIQVPHGEVAGYLCAADVGVLFREDTLTNNVAAPIKFSEYMCCGLPCIISENIGDTAQVLRSGHAGIVLDSERGSPTLDEFLNLLSLNREEISMVMGQKFSSQIYLSEIFKLYRAFTGSKIS